MLFRVFDKNTLVPFALLPFLMLLLWAKVLFGEQLPPLGYEVPMPLSELTGLLINNQSQLLPLISLFLAFLSVYALNRLNTKYVLLRRQSLLPGVVFLIFVSGYTQVQELHAIWFFTPLLAWAIHKLFEAGTHEESSLDIFNMMLLIAIGSLFFARALYFVPLFWCGMVIVNVMTLRNFMASLLGIITPYLLTFATYFYIDRFEELIETILENLFSPVAMFNHSNLSVVYNGVLVVLMFLALLAAFRQSSSLKILTRRYYRFMIWLIIFCIFLAATPFFSMELIPLMGVCSSLVLCNFFESVKSKFWQNLFFYLFIGITLLTQLLG